MPVHPNNLIAIAFDQPMDQASTVGAFSLHDYNQGRPTRGGLTWCENTLIFYPEGETLVPYTNYIISLASSAHNASGEPILEEDFVFVFNTAGYELVHFGFGIGVQTLESSGHRTLPFKLSKFAAPKLTAALYPLTALQFSHAYEQQFTGYLEERAYPTTNLSPSEQWTFAVDASTAIYEIRELTLPESVPPGLYLLQLTAPQGSDQLLLALTDYGLTVKELPQSWSAWVTNYDGVPQPGVPVEFYSQTGYLLAAGQTDMNGTFTMAANGLPEIPVFAAAGAGSQKAVTFFEEQWQTGYYFSPDFGCEESWPVQPQYTVYIYTDSSIYRPGDTVNFRALILRHEAGILTPVPAGTTILVHSPGSSSPNQTYATDSFGTLEGQYQLSNTALPDTYNLELTVNEESFTQTFRVMPTQNPTNAAEHVSVIAEPETYTTDHSITITVQLQDAAGQALTGKEVFITLFEYGPGGWYDHDRYDASNIGYTNDEGQVQLVLPTLPNSYGYGAWGILVRSPLNSTWKVIRPSYQPVSTIAIDLGAQAKLPGQPFLVQGQMLNADGEPMSGRELTLELYRAIFYNFGFSELVQSATVTTDSDGRFTYPLTIDQTSYYSVVVKGMDEQGQQREAAVTVYIPGLRDDHYARNLRVIPEQGSYAIGDTATIFVESTFSGPALLTIEQDKLRRTTLIELNGPITALTLPIEQGDAPNLFVTVQGWARQEGTPETVLYTANTNIVVRPPLLNVQIVPEQTTTGAGEAANFTVLVTDQQGQPVVAEFSLGLISAERFGPPVEPIQTIYQEWPHHHHSYNNLWLSRRWDDFFDYYECHGGGEDIPSPRWPNFPFPAPAVWQPTITTDANGRATVTLTMPDTPGDWRLTVKAIAAGAQVGETSLVVPIE